MESTSDLDEIRPVANIEEMEAVYRLTHTCYVAKGYAKPQSHGLLLHYPEFDILPETTVLVALHHGQIIGSISYTMKGPFGFTIDHDFKEEIDQLRREGRRVLAIWRLIVDDSHRASRQVVLALFTETLRRILTEKVDLFLLVVNPQHERVYQRLFNAKTISKKEGSAEGLSDAPAALLGIEREGLIQKWRLNDRGIKMHQPIGIGVLEQFLDPLDSFMP